MSNEGNSGFLELVLKSQARLAMPIAVYPGVALTGARLSDVVTNPVAQFDAQAALQARYQTPFVLSAMDLSAEAEAFGCELHWSEEEVPSVTGRLVTSLEEARKLAVPKPGDRRTSVYLQTVALLRREFPKKLVLGGCIGPFSLAARMVGVSEALELTMAEPELMHLVLAKAAEFLGAYVSAFQRSGADGIIMAEPAAGLLSPKGMREFSSAYIKQIAASTATGHFTLIYHNCAARLLHLPAILETQLNAYHFGAPMDLPAALRQVPHGVIICGNLDPAAVLIQSSPADIRLKVRDLLKAVEGFPNFVLSSGCDVPARAPLANLDAFFEAVGVSVKEVATGPKLSTKTV